MRLREVGGTPPLAHYIAWVWFGRPDGKSNHQSPMVVAALYDIHGNLPALEAVRAELGDAAVSLVVVGGDVLPGPMPVEALDLLDDLGVPVRYLTGNGDRETLAAADGREMTTVPPMYRPLVKWGADQLRVDQVEALRQWPKTLELEVAGLGPVLFCHATPRNDMDIFTRLTPDARIAPAFADVTAPIVVCGHTHMAFDRQIGPTRVLNAGSVGMPFGEPGAHWLLLDAAGPRFRHTRYDLEAAAARIRRTSYPDAAGFAANHVLNPPAEDAMLKAFGDGR
jgi:predicted phosphodiesterase